jgi:photosystem II stability/assembly factor-like uncharacterized protein
MLDHSKGWALTDDNILFTSDGGQNWNNITPSGSGYGKHAYGDFMDAKYAWVVSTAQPIDSSVSVLRTSDGGLHWQSSKISVSDVSVLDYPHFLTTQEGFLELGIGGGAAGSQGVGIFHTTDGGQNWTQVSGTQQANGLPLGGHKSGIAFKDVHNGWATGEDASVTPWLYVTHDGGHTWGAQSILSGGSSTTAQGYSVTPPVFFGDTGFLPVTVTIQGANTSHVMMIYKTANGGATWSVINSEHSFGDSTASGYASSDLYIADINHAWGNDGAGRLWGTSDGFNNWQLLNSQVALDGNKMNALSFVDTLYGWGITDTKLFHTTDGGKNWSEIVYHVLG